MNEKIKIPIYVTITTLTMYLFSRLEAYKQGINNFLLIFLLMFFVIIVVGVVIPSFFVKKPKKIVEKKDEFIKPLNKKGDFS